ncbi:GAF domain-containing protein [Amycolatopsis oliviviridis]|uniref:Transcriptional regulator n=1 Tax=Amycolatopsis oliviviridis TaxID=1471590 RepID=A0ABQ3LMF6_9PSEU|nr:helix-turn-helix domain-containing protein [Amycolatopsis oliviviridis]GHH17505.1 transcriptional regulator [Amycolatopsis oliviviridis]
MAELPGGEASPRDPQAYARLLKDVREAVLSGVPSPRSPRSIVSASWNRSLAAQVDPDTGVAPLVYDSGELSGLRDEHPLAPVLPILRQTLVSIADDAEHMMIVTDAAGHILWREGAAGVLRRADGVMLAEGTRWSEDVIGTNAMGTTLATGEPVQIYSAEHLVRTYHGWTCAAAPVRDPETGALLGSIDVSGPLRTVHPAMLALVTAAAQLAEGQLRARLAMRDVRLRNRGPSRRPRLALKFLTDGPPSTTVDGREVPFTLRHAEILTLLALHPGGLTAERLALLLYGESGNPVTVRAEIHRLRTQLGTEIVQTRPYRLSAEVDADFLRVRAALKRGDVTGAANAFRGPLLAESESPAIREERESVTASVRRVVLGSRDASALWSYWETACGADDVEIVDALCRVLPDGDPRRAVAFTHRARLNH